MDETFKKALGLLRVVKCVTFATVDDDEPAVRIIDVILVDDEGLYLAEGEPYVVDARNCQVCGRCAEVCPVGAIERASGL